MFQHIIIQWFTIKTSPPPFFPHIFPCGFLIETCHPLNTVISASYSNHKRRRAVILFITRVLHGAHQKSDCTVSLGHIRPLRFHEFITHSTSAKKKKEKEHLDQTMNYK